MAYNELTCGTSAGNTGLQSCVENFGNIEMLLLVDKDFEISTKTLAETELTYTTAINAAIASRMYPLFGHFNAEFDPEGRVQEDGWAGKSETVRQGKNKATFIFDNISFYNHKELRKHNNRTNLGILRVSANGYIQGYSIDDTIMKPLPLSDFFVNDRNDSDGDTIDRSSVYLEYAGSQWDDNGVWVKPTDFDPLLLDGIKDVSITGTLLAPGETVTVKGASDQVGVAGLIAANFSLVDDLAPTVLIPVVVGVDNGDGTYDLTHASITGAHTMTLIDQPIGTSGYEAIDSISTTV